MCGCRVGVCMSEDLSQDIACFSSQLSSWMCCRIRMVAVVRRGSISVVLCDLSMPIVLS